MEGLSVTERVEVVPYAPAWTQEYQHESGRIRSALGKNALSLSHIGSTAVPGMAARPVIDILAEVKYREKAVRTLSEMGYQPIAGEAMLERPGFRVLVLERRERETIDRCRALVDYLRANERRREEYSQLKLYLVQAYPGDLMLYQEGKSGFLAQLEEEARNACPVEPSGTNTGRSAALGLGVGAGLVMGLTVFHNIGIGLCVGLCFAMLLSKWNRD